MAIRVRHLRWRGLRWVRSDGVGAGVATRPWPPSAADVVKAYIRWLNRDGAVYEIVGRPDTIERTRPAIDYVLRDANTGHELAVEVSSIWRSTDAGMEDAYIDKWFEKARRLVVDRVPGLFYISLPIRVPAGADAGQSAEALVHTIRANESLIARAGQQARMLFFTVDGIDIWISLHPLNANGSDIQYSRSMPDMTDFPSRVRACLDEKAPKLKPYSNAGTETWIVIFNTMGIAMSPLDAERIVNQECGPSHAHVTHIALVAGNPPDDTYVHLVR
jgi:hypothetical protein